jgi:hypothetical protein
MDMYLNALIVSLNIMAMITFGVSFGYVLVKSIKSEDTENFAKRFFGMIALGLVGVLFFTITLGAIFDCGTEIILEILARKQM